MNASVKDTFKVALIGAGKTGSKIKESLLPSQLTDVFDETNPPSAKALAKADIVIVFTPGDAMLPLIPILLEAKRPCIVGSTGFTWPSDIDQKLKAEKLTWIRSHNYSLGMTLVHHMLRILSLSPLLLDHPEFHVHEIHHVHKKDAPSGTALSWKEWLDEERGQKKIDITSERIGDVAGVHQLTVKTSSEKIFIEHEAFNRKIFADGAIWTAKQLTSRTDLPHGLVSFEDLTSSLLKIHLKDVL